MIKITPTAKARCNDPAHTLADQLAQHLDQLKTDHDQDDVAVAFEADESWSGQHQRLTNPDAGIPASNSKGWDRV